MVTQAEFNKYTVGDYVVLSTYYSSNDKRFGSKYLAKITHNSDIQIQADIGRIYDHPDLILRRVVFYFDDIMKIRKATEKEVKECDRLITFNKL